MEIHIFAPRPASKRIARTFLIQIYPHLIIHSLASARPQNKTAVIVPINFKKYIYNTTYRIYTLEKAKKRRAARARRRNSKFVLNKCPVLHKFSYRARAHTPRHVISTIRLFFFFSARRRDVRSRIRDREIEASERKSVVKCMRACVRVCVGHIDVCGLYGARKFCRANLAVRFFEKEKNRVREREREFSKVLFLKDIYVFAVFVLL